MSQITLLCMDSSTYTGSADFVFTHPYAPLPPQLHKLPMILNLAHRGSASKRVQQAEAWVGGRKLVELSCWAEKGWNAVYAVNLPKRPIDLTDLMPQNVYSGGGCFPPGLVRRLLTLYADCLQEGAVIWDGFMGRGTVGKVALEMGYRFVGIDIAPTRTRFAAKYLGVDIREVGHANSRQSPRREEGNSSAVQRRNDAGGDADNRMVAVCGDAERPARRLSARERRALDLRTAARGVPGKEMVERQPRTPRQHKDGGSRRMQRERAGLGNHRATIPENGSWDTRRRSGLVHPKRALVIGGGAAVWDEILALESLYGRQWDGIVIAVNDAGSHWPRALDHWTTLHPERMPGWEELRREHGFDMDYVTWGRRPNLMDRVIKPWGGGSSGMLAVVVARALDCTRCVLCGIPMTNTAHFKESTVHQNKPNWPHAENHWKVWTRFKDNMLGWVTSMSGRTRNLLGAPTRAWLEEESDVEG